MRPVDTRRRRPSTTGLGPKQRPSSFSLIVPESDFLELMARVDRLTTPLSVHAATLVAGMSASKRRSGQRR